MLPSTEIVDFMYTWKVEHFSEKLKIGYLQSPHFLVNDFLKKTEWNLSMYCDDFLSVYLNIKNAVSIPDKSTLIDFTITIVSANLSLHISEKITSKRFTPNDCGFGFSLVKLKKILNERHLYFPQDTLIVQCYMIQKDKKDIEEFDIPEGNSTSLQNVNHTNTLNKDLNDLYLNKKFCDMKIRTSDQVFPGHKSVICARSPVFSAMFEDDTEEKKTGAVDIVDIDTPTVSRMLTFIYSDSVEDMNLDQAAKLYAAADKYCILSLKEKCSATLKSLLSYANVGDVYALADMHQDADLKSAVKCYVFIYAKRVFKSPEWEHFMKFKPELSSELMHYLWIKQLDD